MDLTLHQRVWILKCVCDNSLVSDIVSTEQLIEVSRKSVQCQLNLESPCLRMSSSSAYTLHGYHVRSVCWFAELKFTWRNLDSKAL